MISFDFFLSPWVIDLAIVILGIIVYSVIGVVVANIADRFTDCGKAACELIIFLWPLFVVAFFVWWTVCLPARLIYKLLKKD